MNSKGSDIGVVFKTYNELTANEVGKLRSFTQQKFWMFFARVMDKIHTQL